MFCFVSPILYQKLLWKFYQDPTCLGYFRENLEVWVEVFDSAFSRPMIGQLSPFFVSHWWRDQNWTALGLGGGVGWEGHTNNLSQNESNMKQPTQPNWLKAPPKNLCCNSDCSISISQLFPHFDNSHIPEIYLSAIIRLYLWYKYPVN